MALVERVYPGDSQPYSIEIRDAAAVLFDPAEIRVHVKSNDGVTTTYTYIGVNNQIVRNSVGRFTFTMAFPYESEAVGRWNFDVQVIDGAGTPVSKKVKPFQETIYESGAL